jgi:hypothetical protein
MFREHRKGRVVEVGHVMVQVVLGAIGLLIVGMTLLIFSVVISWAAGVIAAVVLAVLLVTLLAVVPRRLERR